MRDFSVDIQTEKIYSAKTREYFDEVIKSYYSESYRSAVVMLYSIVIADLIYKIEELKELYADSSAIDILDEITELQKRNPTSPDWESKLVELVKEKTNLLEPADFLHLTTLQKHRHLCAHPVLTQNFELYRPNIETTRAHIRNMLEGVLVKPPVLSRKIFEDLVLNLASIKTIIYNDNQLEKHLNAKYFDRINEKTLKHIFRSLWKITFKTINVQCDENREINLKALSIVLKNNYQKLFDLITNEKDYYSDIAVKNLTVFISLLNQFPNIFDKLNESAKILAINTINKDADLDTFAIFLTKDIEKHIEKVLAISWDSVYENSDITTQSILEVFNHAINDGKRDLAYDFLIKMFANSGQYSTADSRFDNLIQPYLKNYNNEELKMIVKEVNDNSQIYDRRKARSTNYQIKQRIDEVTDGFDFAKYKNFKY
jgi:hypothetical protein